MKIAVDAMGGDNAPQTVVAGVERARDEFTDLEFILFGKENEIKKYLKNEDRIKIVHTDEEIVMNDEPVRAIRRKKNSSMVLAAKAVKEQQADAFFSCGNTGALLAAGLLIVGRIKGITRPGLLSTMPVLGQTDGAFNLLDSGANAENKPEHLHQYAILGKYYAQRVRGIENPRIGLLNNGTEPHKGSQVTQAAYHLLSADESLNFVGNVEANAILKGVADVVVADGFTGNAVLKAIEGAAGAMVHLLKETIMKSGVVGKLGALLLKSSLSGLKDKMDQSRYGGAVLLGVKAPVVKAHGASDSTAVYYTLRQIHKMLKEEMVPELVSYFAQQEEKKAAQKTEEKND
ncbi:phosphate acyltransferase PlsX [Liquorilactobacillus satsumensis]|uniref:Phosphate acyltransferase n=2 Tax=Liquorilactobacillus satsumensis TaxID=259059 RepID=A0A0R1VA77_9LACO|nr:phosphate acyltransferase PlsX [Liquorilactobacillus satsumensis]KRL99893.1 Fatty acid phospholipid synthesis protein [Liquorilactobacillus satsumensis DSM 16230 = JCM 12392]MCC7665615.1 phosphate acetyltransferase PlsX [Liquorilactobacillus satsumensis]MCP9311827.1 phosphate acyltransferase PlsX [Liquorilactobacillus satsumensis]MCP9328373.1 phosphate acyltransferase PlsX [Liquorilactobacillus satsumensis]MCP9358000.1 phosphate acyltransferase PlsX [Liquorilactobacillus satsumensis]